jgi:hypothetical protein
MNKAAAKFAMTVNTYGTCGGFGLRQPFGAYVNAANTLAIRAAPSAM